MDVRALVEKLWSIVEPVVESKGLELLEVEFQREPRGWVLRLYIDREEGGVTLDDCVSVSREVGDLLDVKDPIGCRYHLEVSSPGLDRPLRRPKDFVKWLGHKIRVTTMGEGKGVIQGVLVGFEEGAIEVQTTAGLRRIFLEHVAKARLVPDYGDWTPKKEREKGCN